MKETRKENFMKFLDNAFNNGNGVTIEIDNPKQPFLHSLGYSNRILPEIKNEYQNSYDDDLKYLNDKSIRIKEYRLI